MYPVQLQQATDHLDVPDLRYVEQPARGVPEQRRHHRLGDEVLGATHLDLPAQRHRYRLRLRGDRHRWLLRHQLDEIVQVQVVLVHPGEAAEDALDRVLHRNRGLRIGGQGANRKMACDRLERDVQIGERGDDRADVAKRESGHVATNHL